MVKNQTRYSRCGCLTWGCYVGWLSIFWFLCCIIFMAKVVKPAGPWLYLMSGSFWTREVYHWQFGQTAYIAECLLWTMCVEHTCTFGNRIQTFLNLTHRRATKIIKWLVTAKLTMSRTYISHNLICYLCLMHLVPLI